MGRSKAKGLRAALELRQLKHTHYDMPVVPYDEALQARQAVQLAQQTLAAATYLQAREGESEETKEAVTEAREALDRAEEEERACFYRIEIQGLPELTFDALVQLHPPTEEEAAGAEPELWHKDSLFPELLAACAEGDLTAEEWAEQLAGWGKGEKAELWARLLDANVRSYATSLGFG